MKISISDLTKVNGSQREINLQEKLEEINFNGDNIRFIEPIKLKGIIRNESGIIKLKGELNLVVELNCHRCSKNLEQVINIGIDENYTNTEKAPDDFYKYSGNEIDFSPMILDNILTNMPMKILCSEDCKGLCEVCGCDRNLEDCSCKIQQYDPRFEALLKLRDKEFR